MHDPTRINQELIEENTALKQRIQELELSDSQGKQMDQRLRESEEKFRILVENANDIVFSLTPEGVFTYVSPTWTRMLGHDISEVENHSFQPFVHPEDLPGCLEFLERAMKTGEKQAGIEYRVLHKDGSWRWHTTNASPIHDASGKVVAGIGISRDITVRKKAEFARYESEQRLSAIIDFLPDATLSIDKDKRIIIWNRAIEKMTGIPAKEMIGKGDYAYTIPFYGVARPQLMDLFWEPEHEIATKYPMIQKEGENLVIEVFCPVLDGGRGAFVWAKASPLRDSGGQLIGAIECIRDITEQKQKTEAFQENERRLSNLMGNLPGMAYRCTNDKDWTMAFVSAGSYALLGYAPEDIINNSKISYNALIHPADQQRVWNEVQAALIRDDHYVIEYRICIAGGKEKWVWEQGCGVFSKDGELLALEGFITDITERKRAERLLADNEARMRTLFQTIPDLIWLKDVEGVYLACNTMFERFFGAKEADIIGKTDYDFVDGELADFFREHDRKAMAAGKPSSNEEWLTFADDGYHGLFDTLKTPMYGAGGQLIGVLGIARDATERKRTEDALRESEAKYRMVVESSLVGVYIIQDGLVRFVNKRWCEIYGYKFEEVVDRLNPLDAVHPDDRALVQENMRKRLADEMAYIDYEFRALRKDGEVVAVRVLGGNIIYRGRDAITGTIIDVTRERSLESQLIQAQKMEAIGTLAGGIAHDFNNILSGIMGYSELCLMEVQGQSKIYRNIEQVLKATERAKSLVRQILTFSRKAVHEKKPIALSPLVHEVVTFMRASLPTTIEIKHTIEVTSDVIMADPTQLHQVLINLCTNAGYAMKKTGGVLEIGLGEVGINVDGPLTHPPMPQGHYLVLTVMDTGVGISQNNLTRIFDPYFTTKEKGEGTGLGLAVVHGIVKDHGGEIRVYSKEGKGTIFRVYLPLMEKQVEGDKDNEEALLAGKGEKILFIDDEEMVVDLSKALLDQLGYRLVTETDPVKAIEVFKKDYASFDLVITDKTMPHMTGFDVVREVRRIRADIPVVLSSGFQENEDLEKLTTLGINQLITKPIRISILAKTIRDVLDKIN